MSVRCPQCPYDVRTMSVRCPFVCPLYVRCMSVVCPLYVRCMSNHVPLYVQARLYTSVRRPDVSGHTHHPPLLRREAIEIRNTEGGEPYIG